MGTQAGGGGGGGGIRIEALHSLNDFNQDVEIPCTPGGSSVI